MCNGTGEVKYYFGDGDDDYKMGPCSDSNNVTIDVENLGMRFTEVRDALESLYLKYYEERDSR